MFKRDLNFYVNVSIVSSNLMNLEKSLEIKKAAITIIDANLMDQRQNSIQFLS